MGDFLAAIITFALIVVVLAFLIALPVMWCWNYVMPDLFGLIEINFWQALVLSMLTSMLFKSTTTSKD